MYRTLLAHLQAAYTNADFVAIVCCCRCGLVPRPNYICVRVVPPEDGQVMPETCRDIEP
jgi:hypothetical protein